MVSCSIVGAVILNNKSKLEALIVQNEQQLEIKRVDQENADKKEKERIDNYNKCKDQAYSDYSATWDNSCVARGLKADCSLPLPIREQLETALQKDTENCVKIYSK